VAPTSPSSPGAAPAASGEPVVASSSGPDPASSNAPAASAAGSAASSGVTQPNAAPAVTASVSAAPASVPLTPEEQKIVAMCTGKASMFTEKEEALLRLADQKGDPGVKEQADAIRRRRRDTLNEACERLRAAGKL
jgi:hypothetical protein